MAPIAFYFYFSYTFILLPFYVAAQTRGNITLGASLTANNDNSSWFSPSGDFAFGFQHLGGDKFLPCIWFARIPGRTIAWYADDDGATAPRGSKLVLTSNEGLVLSDPKGTKLWSPQMDPGIVNYGFLSDFGNFVLKTSKNETLWQSFDHPRDTLLPTQTMEEEGTLTSRLSESKFTRGRFELRFFSGNLVLNTRNMLTNASYANTFYYNSNFEYKNSTTGSSPKLIYDHSGQTYILGSDGATYNLPLETKVSSADYYQRVTLNFDGVLTWYYYPRNSRDSSNTSWAVAQNQPDNICVEIRGGYGSGACGFNSICSLGNDKRPICNCPPSYSLVDANDRYGSCKPNFNLACGEDGYRLVELHLTDWPFSDYDKLDSVDIDQCKAFCTSDCFCAAAMFSENTCWKKKLPLSNGRNNSPDGRMTLLKVKDIDDFPRGPLSPNQYMKTDCKSLNKVLSVFLGSSVFLNLILFTVICLGGFYAYHKLLKRACVVPKQATVEYNVHYFSYGELQEATDGFSQELGSGAFGIVYKGAIANCGTNGSKTYVAVKKLDRLDGEREFRTEVDVIGQTHHKNLVRLIGFCDEGQHRLLVYEFMGNGTLADFLFGEFKPSWTQRIKVVQGISAGILYLHEECETQIIHCDIKPQNVLLDDYHSPRISDFGLAKLLMLDQSHTHTAIRGTKGYVALEWFRNRPVTTKVDVFSFGVLLLEIICCRKNIRLDLNNTGGDVRAILTDWASDCYQSRALDALVDYDLETLQDRQRLERFVAVALWCVQEEPNQRPTMRKVTQMLEGLVPVSAPPPPDSSSIHVDA